MERNTSTLAAIFRMIEKGLSLAYTMGPLNFSDTTDSSVSAWKKVQTPTGLFRITVERIPNYE